ncbi:MAG: hypothetical protein QOI11_2917 [Candidatus Eremiobacteraeota bacterium]|jgi:hypothetical protein|nr:hypothetical protein [Candidatus Eremiobacteraeota bacterium]
MSRVPFAAACALALFGLPLRAGAQSPPAPPPPPTPPPLASPSAPLPSATPLPGETPTPSTPPLPGETPAPGATPLPGETPAPGQTPAPGATPTPIPSGAPSVSPQPGVPIRIDRAKVGVVPGGTVVLSVAGGIGPLTAQPSFSGVNARYDPLARTLTLSGGAPGRGTVTLADAAGDSASVNVLVAPPAGVVPADAAVELAGEVAPDFAASRIQAALDQLAQRRPGSTVTYRGVTLPAALHPGDVLDAQAQVRVDGYDAYVDASGTTGVHLRVAALPKLDPQVLFYSDDPERLGAGADGVLFRGTVDAARPARAYVYHVSDTPGRRLYLALRAAGASTRVQVLGAMAGPNDAFSYVGHTSTLRYLQTRPAQQSYVATVTPDAPYLIPLGAPMKAGELVSAIQDLRVLEGGPLEVDVVAAGTDAAALAYLNGPELPGDGHGRRGEFALDAVPPLALAYTVGGAEPAPFVIGNALIPNLRPGGRALAGDYGVLRPVQLQLANPTPSPQNVFLYEVAGGGGATTTFRFDGDPAPTSVLCVNDPANRYLVKQFALAPGETRTVTGEYMTDGTSYLPIDFGLSATPPLAVPPKACNPRPAA